MSDYRPIVFEKEFAPRKFYGWACLRETPVFQHLALKQGPFLRHLLLFHGADAATVQTTLAEETGRLSGCSELRIYCYPALPEGCSSVVWRGRKLDAATPHDRIFNAQTFVHDLRQSEAALFSALHDNARRNASKAAKEGFSVRFHKSPDEALLARFMEFYRQMAGERGLRVPDLPVLRKMAGAGNLIGAELRKGEAFGGTILLLYRCGNHAIYLYGVSEPGDKNKFANFVQWEAIKYLRAAGVDWYDLGGVPSLDKENGLYRFKSALGGKFVGPTTELVSRTAAFRAARWLKEKVPR